MGGIISERKGVGWMHRGLKEEDQYELCSFLGSFFPQRRIVQKRSSLDLELLKGIGDSLGSDIAH